MVTRKCDSEIFLTIMGMSCVVSFVCVALKTEHNCNPDSLVNAVQINVKFNNCLYEKLIIYLTLTGTEDTPPSLGLTDTEML